MSSEDYENDAWRPTTDVERQQVRDQLKKLLSSSHFLISKRYPNLLRFVVEQTLAGQEDALKERLLGIEVFHRAADYDTNQDPVVRLSAAEVRKRIALYYQQPQHKNELMIGLNPGSYVPYFRPAQAPPAPTESASAPSAILMPEAADTKRGMAVSRTRFWPYAVAALVVAAVGLGLGWHFWFRPSVADQFWSPISRSPSLVTLCVGSPDSVDQALQNSPSPATVYDSIRRSGRLGTANVATLIRVGGVLEGRHKPFRLLLASKASFPELREGPVVLVGALDNDWALRLTQSLRYGFGMDNNAMYIVDHKNPAARNWSVLLKQPPSSQSSDFAIIARYHDTTLDQPVVLAAGLSSEGTEAAGEVLSDPGFLKALFQNAPRDWKTVNMEAVVQTQVIEGHPGPSRILAIEYW
ncbi:MAG TPA: hypothetical protein VM554_14865 [Acidisarcina sp.]|nr:hypothetical protein [Acidisarcina sp.]